MNNNQELYLEFWKKQSKNLNLTKKQTNLLLNSELIEPEVLKSWVLEKVKNAFVLNKRKVIYETEYNQNKKQNIIRGIKFADYKRDKPQEVFYNTYEGNLLMDEIRKYQKTLQQQQDIQEPGEH